MKWARGKSDGILLQKEVFVFIIVIIIVHILEIHLNFMYCGMWISKHRLQDQLQQQI